MEDQVRTTSVTRTATALVPAEASLLPNGGNPWLASPAFDLCFLANLWWPVVVLLGWLAGGTDTWFGFWQIYFLTTPHRWLTLLLVVADPDRRAGRTGWLALLALAITAGVGGVWLATGQLVCLALLDYLWNAWHFGSQHGGIARMYARRTAVAASPEQTWSLRLLVVYSAVRVAGWSTGWIDASAGGPWLLASIDVLVVAGAAFGAWRAFRAASVAVSTGWRTYVGSIVLLYAALLSAVNLRSGLLVAGLVAVGAAMHAMEYLAIVSYYARRREHRGSRGLFSTLARQWTWLLLAYVVLLGSLSFFSEQRWREAWLAINLVAAFLHYAYDGMIWRLRDARTSSTLGVGLGGPTGAMP